MDANKMGPCFSALCIHKVPEGLAARQFLLMGAGMHRRPRRFGWVAAVEATRRWSGGVIGYLFSDERFRTFWLGLNHGRTLGGGFIYLATHARSWRKC